MVESQPSKLLVAGSIPVSRSTSSGSSGLQLYLAIGVPITAVLSSLTVSLVQIYDI